MTRRQALVLIGAGAVSAATGATGLVQGWGSPTRRANERSSGATGRELVEPEVIDSDGGSLEATLTAAAGRVNLAGTTVGLDTVEERTITNDSPMDHPLHLHVWPMQVVTRNGQAVDGSPQWLDVVNVPAEGPVRVRFSDFPGRTVHNCHILDHEDQGMMAIVEART